MKRPFLRVLPGLMMGFMLCVLFSAEAYAAAKPGLILGTLHGFSADKAKLDAHYGGGVTVPLDARARMNIEGYIGKVKTVNDVPDGQWSNDKNRLYMATVDYVVGAGGGSYFFAGGGFAYEKLKYDYQYGSGGAIVRESRSESGTSVVTDAGLVLRMTRGMSVMLRFLFFAGGKNLKTAGTFSLMFD